MISPQGQAGVLFAVWAPNAKYVSVVGDFNSWNPQSHPLKMRGDESGIWEGFIPGIRKGALYKFHIVSHHNNYQTQRADPFAFGSEISPGTASRVCDLKYSWKDSQWMKERKKRNAHDAPISIYELHLGSWRRGGENGEKYLNYREIARYLIPYLKKTGFSHVEFMPVMEHPYYPSWGYQVLGYFAPTSRYGSSQDFMALIDELHQSDIGVILDWVPSHFPTDGHGLAYFDGTHLYEHADPRRGFHPDWKCYIFNHGRNEVKEFLISSALFWLDKYHIDGLRVDAVASMLYLDYSRKEGEWLPNQYGGKENIESIEFLRRFNQIVYEKFPDIQTIAEESTSWSGVSRPTHESGGLGFGFKWNMGWMHDTLKYFSLDPYFRKHHHHELTFSMLYSFHENFILSLSHDEVVHGKGSLYWKMPGDEWQKHANLRCLYGYMFGHPGKKLLFMGGEFGQWIEWYQEKSLDWHVLQYPFHQGMLRWISDLNAFYRKEPAFYSDDFSPSGFQWIEVNDWQQSVIAFRRIAKVTGEQVIVVCNMTSVVRENYRIGISESGLWKEVLNSDAKEYAGSGIGNFGAKETDSQPSHDQPFSLVLTLPPLGVLYLKKK